MVTRFARLSGGYRAVAKAVRSGQDWPHVPNRISRPTSHQRSDESGQAVKLGIDLLEMTFDLPAGGRRITQRATSVC